MSKPFQDVMYWKKKYEEQSRELERVHAQLEAQRQLEEERRQILKLPPPIDRNPIPKTKRDLLNPSQPAKTKRTIKYKGLENPTLMATSKRQKKSSPPTVTRRDSPPKMPPITSPKKASPPKPLKSSLKKSPPKTFIIRPVDFVTGKAVNTPPIVVEKEMIIGRPNFKSLLSEKYYERIPREAFRVTTEDDELIVTALRDNIEYQQAQSSRSKLIEKDTSVYLDSGDKVSIKNVLSFKISR